MTFKIFGSIALTVLVGAPLYSLADECPKGQLCNIFEEILKDKGGPFAGFASSSGSSLANFQFQQKTACEAVGAKCTDEERLGCSRVAKSVIGGVIECWGANDKNFKLLNYKDGTSVNYRSFDVVTNLANNNTDHGLIIARGINGAFLLNENGQEIAAGDALGCDDFQAAGEGKIACIQDGKKFVLNVEDLEKARISSVKVGDISDSIAINLCTIALNEVASARAKGNFLTNIFRGKEKTFTGIGETPVKILTHNQQHGDMSAKCSIDPDSEKTCSAIYLTKKGLECFNYGALDYIKPFKTTSEFLETAAKKYVFNNSEIVKMSDIFENTQKIPVYIKILRPDNLINSTHYITKATTNSGGLGATR